MSGFVLSELIAISIEVRSRDVRSFEESVLSKDLFDRSAAFFYQAHRSAEDPKFHLLVVQA